MFMVINISKKGITLIIYKIFIIVKKINLMP